MTRNWNKIIQKRKVVKLSAIFLFAIVFTVACKKDDALGDSLQNQSLGQHTIDTFSLITYTEEIDSMTSDETTVNMLGAYNDPVFGNVDCGFATQVRLSSVNPSLGTSGTTTVDSMVLSLRFTGINYYANLNDITVEVYEITDDLVRTDQEYYTFQVPNTSATNLVVPGMETIQPDIVKDVIVGGDTLAPHVRIHLDPNLGSQLIDINSSGGMNSDDAFVSAFKGLYVKVNMPGLSSGQGSILYFSLENALSELTMYFHTDTDPTIQDFSFLINSSAARYNVTSFDRSGTVVQDAIDLGKDYQKEFYMQCSALRGVIELPHIMDLNYDSLGNYKPKIINYAALVLPIQDYQPDPFDPSTSLFIARIVDEKLSTFTLDYFAQSFNTVTYNEDTKSFTFVLTREIQNILNESIENKGFRIYSPNFFSSSVERIVFNGAETELKDKPKLIISYTEY